MSKVISPRMCFSGDDDVPPPPPLDSPVHLSPQLPSQRLSQRRGQQLQEALYGQHHTTNEFVDRFGVQVPAREFYSEINIDSSFAALLTKRVHQAYVTNLSISKCIREWKPTKGDIIVCANDTNAQLMTCKMAQLLLEDVPESKFRYAPWVEARTSTTADFMKLDPDKREVFRTTMTCEHLAQTDILNRGSGFFVVVRNPADARLARFLTIRDIALDKAEAATSGSRAQAAAKFDARFTPDDFVEAPPPQCEFNKLESHSHDGAYETNLKNWMEARDKPRVFILFYEELISNPLSYLDRLARYMGVDPSSKTRASILKRTFMSKTDVHNLFMTPSQLNALPQIKVILGSDEELEQPMQLEFSSVAAIGVDRDWRTFVDKELNKKKSAAEDSSIKKKLVWSGNYEAMYFEFVGSKYPFARSIKRENSLAKFDSHGSFRRENSSGRPSSTESSSSSTSTRSPFRVLADKLKGSSRRFSLGSHCSAESKSPCA